MRPLCLLIIGCALSRSFLPAQAVLSFEDAARLAVVSSLELKSAKAGRALREGSWKLGLRAYFPQFSFMISEDDRLSTINADSFLKNYTVSLDQLIWDGGRTSAARATERSELVLLGDELEHNESAIAETAVNAYRQILILQKIIAIREAAMESLIEQRRVLEEELALGMVTALDLASGEITVLEAELELESLNMEAEKSARSFAELLGLDQAPRLGESLDIYRNAEALDAEMVRRAALSRNPDLVSRRHLILRRRTESKYASLSWLPTLRATGSFSVSGQRYPLSRYSWSAGITVNFSSPWFNLSAGGSAGWEAPYDKTARVQTSASPLPDPASGLGAKQAELALALELENYRVSFERTGRAAILLTDSIALAEKRRRSTIAELELAEKKYRLTMTLAGLGRVTRVEQMEARIEYAEKEIKAVEAAAALLASERELEKFLALKPGMLSQFLNRFGGKP